MDQRWGMLNCSQLGGGGGGHGVAPGAELRQLVAVLVKGEIAVHHGGHAKARQAGQLHAVAVLHVLFHVCIGVLQACPHILHVVGPYAVFQAVFPGVVAGGNGGMVCADQHSLDAGGAKLHAQHGLAG